MSWVPKSRGHVSLISVLTMPVCFTCVFSQNIAYYAQYVDQLTNTYIFVTYCAFVNHVAST